MNFEKKLTIIVPTYNHSEYIDYYLSQMECIDNMNVLLEIHDSSTNDDTKKVVETYQTHISNLKYYRYSDINVDVKTILALQKCNTEYAFLCGDGVIFNIEKCGERVLSAITSKYDVIELYDEATPKHYNYYNALEKKYKKQDIIYDDIKTHFVENIWHMPYYGGSIVKVEVFKNASMEQMKQIIGLGFVYPYMIYSFPYKDYHAIVMGGDFHIRNPHKKMAIWESTQKSGIKIWAKNFPETINHLPSEYDSIKERTIILAEKTLGYLTLKGLINLRLIDNYNYKILKQYKEELKKYAACGLFVQYVIAITPKFMFRILRKIIKMVRR